MKKLIKTILVAILVILIALSACVRINHKNEETLVFWFGEYKRTEKAEGPFLVIPILNSVQHVYVGDRIYDLPASPVTTSDKKQMDADAYAIWDVTDSLKYYKNLANQAIAENRINNGVYNSMKLIISSSSQEEVTGDEALGEKIRANIQIADNYGLEITKVEMKVLDLPFDNKQGVYDRMSSERKVIQEQYNAEGNKAYDTKTAEVDSRVRQIESNARVRAAEIEAEGERQYFQILSDAYASSPERKEFYNYIIQLQALEDGIQSGTIILGSDSPFYEALVDFTK